MDYTVSDWPVRPMEFDAGKAAFDDPDTLFQVKWDGVRCLAYSYPEGIRLINRKLNERTAQYPEITGALSALKPGTVLDGEIVALGDSGRPDFPRVLKRDFARSQAKISLAMRSVPVHYMVFDILWLAGEPVYPLPIEDRLAMLHGLGFESGFIHAVESVEGSGKALFQAVDAEGLEGIVAKKKGSVYRIGQRTEDWKKIKCFRELTALIGGFLTEEGGRVRSLLVGVMEADGLTYIGSAASGVKQSEWARFREIFAGIPGPCPFINRPAQPDARWVQPKIPVSVRFLEYTPEGVMRAPVVLGFPGGL
jgi:bifunctional non-homologous end joining protein LigD